jgi:hypothetical protein
MSSTCVYHRLMPGSELHLYTSMISHGRSSLILKSHVSPVGASRERENPDWCGEASGWGCCRLVVLLGGFR